METNKSLAQYQKNCSRKGETLDSTQESERQCSRHPPCSTNSEILVTRKAAHVSGFKEAEKQNTCSWGQQNKIIKKKKMS